MPFCWVRILVPGGLATPSITRQGQVCGPVSILGGFVAPGQTAVDIGCGLGYFSLALARLVGPDGKVIALDVQPQMVKRAFNRAQHKGLQDIIDFRVCSPDKLGVTESADFVLAFWVVHEVTDQEGLFAEVYTFLKPNGRLLIVEPKGHVSAARFAAMLELARRVGYSVSAGPRVRFSRTALCAPV